MFTSLLIIVLSFDSCIMKGKNAEIKWIELKKKNLCVWHCGYFCWHGVLVVGSMTCCITVRPVRSFLKRGCGFFFDRSAASLEIRASPEKNWWAGGGGGGDSDTFCFLLKHFWSIFQTRGSGNLRTSPTSITSKQQQQKFSPLKGGCGRTHRTPFCFYLSHIPVSCHAYSAAVRKFVNSWLLRNWEGELGHVKRERGGERKERKLYNLGKLLYNKSPLSASS